MTTLAPESNIEDKQEHQLVEFSDGSSELRLNQPGQQIDFNDDVVHKYFRDPLLYGSGAVRMSGKDMDNTPITLFLIDGKAIVTNKIVGAKPKITVIDRQFGDIEHEITEPITIGDPWVSPYGTFQEVTSIGAEYKIGASNPDVILEKQNPYTTLKKLLRDKKISQQAIAGSQSSALSPEKSQATFRATTFAEAEKLYNPVPDTLLRRVVDGYIDKNLFWDSFNVKTPKDSSDLAITQADVESEYEKAKELRNRDDVNYFHTDLQFDHYSTKAYENDFKAGIKRKLTKRIYLNPRQVDRLDIFSELLDELTAKGLAVKTKVLQEPDTREARPDGLVIYSDDEQADRVLAVVQSLSLNHKESFADRIVPFATMNLTDGVGVAAEDSRYTGRESATSIREKIMTSAMTRLAEQVEKNGYDITQVDRSKLASMLKSRLETSYFTQPSVNIDPNNWSFNL